MHIEKHSPILSTFCVSWKQLAYFGRTASSGHRKELYSFQSSFPEDFGLIPQKPS